MKKTIFVLFLLPLQLFAQDFSGLWTGYLYNDTTGDKLHYEILVQEKNGDFFGYSLTNFILNDRLLTGVKRLKLSEIKNKLVVEDDILVYDNYPVRPPKGVKQLSTLSLETKPNHTILNGKFITSRNKHFRALTGKVKLEKSKDYAASRLIKKLRELNLLDEFALLEIPLKDTTPVVVVPKPVPPPTILQLLKERSVQTIKTIWFRSDSLTINLYDNGYVDGDSVSLIINGEVVLKNQRLSQKAITFGLRTDKGKADSIHLTIFAQNLGSVPPNTGLIVINDGNSRYEVNFSGDLKNNQAILLRRKPDN